MPSGSPMSSLALPVAILAGLAGALGGPWVLGHRDKPAKEPFGYALPDGFKPGPADTGSTPRRVWLHAPLGAEGLVPNLTITHVNDMGVFDDAKLAEIARGMPAFFAQTKIVWTEVRHAQIIRKDGSMVGLLEGENAVEDQRSRSLQLTFPDNSGVSLVTANFPSGDAAHWEPIFEATIESSRGVAIRGVTTPIWMRAASGGGAAVVVYLLLLALGRRPPRVATQEASTASVSATEEPPPPPATLAPDPPRPPGLDEPSEG